MTPEEAASRWAVLAIGASISSALFALAIPIVLALGASAGNESGRDAMCAATCADAADWSRTGADCTCLDPVERPARRNRHAAR